MSWTLNKFFSLRIKLTVSIHEVEKSHFVNSWVFYLLVWDLSSHFKNFTHMETSTCEGCKNWYILGTHSHFEVKVSLRATPTVTCVTKRLAMDLSLPVLTSKVCRGRDLISILSASREITLTDCATTATILY